MGAVVDLVLGLAGAFARADDTYLNCDLLLDTFTARAARQVVARRFAAGEAEDHEVAVFVGVSNREMIALLNHGNIRRADAKDLRMPAFLVTAATPLARQLELAKREAWARCTADTLKGRYPHVEIHTERVLGFLRRLHEQVGQAPRTPITFEQIRVAVESSSLVKSKVRSHARLATLAKMFDVPWDTFSRLTPGMRQALAAVFSNLPPKTGVVLALTSRASAVVRSDEGSAPGMKRIRLDDVIGVEALELPEFQFLIKVKDRAGVK